MDSLTQFLRELMATTTPVDWVILAFVTLCAARGAIQGFGTELARLLVVGLVVIGGIPLFHWLMQQVRTAQPELENKAAGELLCFVLTLLLVLLLGRLILLTVRVAVDKALGGWFSHVAGGITGLARGGAIYATALLVILMGPVPGIRAAFVEQSRIGREVAPHLPAPYSWLTERVTFLPRIEALSEPPEE